MTNIADLLTQSRRDLDALDALVIIDPDRPPVAAHRAVKIRVVELTRGGHRSASFSIGIGGGDTILPAFDRPDQTIINLDREYRDAIGQVAKAAQKARVAQERILARARVKKIDTDDTDTTTTDQVWCSSCLRVGCFSPRADQWRATVENTLCRWCLEFERIHTFLPPLELLRVRVEKDAKGQRITEKDLAAAGVVAGAVSGEAVNP